MAHDVESRDAAQPMSKPGLADELEVASDGWDAVDWRDWGVGHEPLWKNTVGVSNSTSSNQAGKSNRSTDPRHPVTWSLDTNLQVVKNYYLFFGARRVSEGDEEFYAIQFALKSPGRAQEPAA